MKKVLLILLAALVICNMTFGLANAAPRKYLGEHWITGRVIGAPDGTIVTLYMAANPTVTTTGTTVGGEYRINAYALGWAAGPTWKIISDPNGEPRAEVLDLLGTGGAAGPVGLAPGEPSPRFSSGKGVERMADMTYSSGVLDIPYGPQVNVKALFQAFVNTTTWTHPEQSVIRAEVREVRSGTDIPANATKLVAYADIVLDREGNTTGRNGFLKPDGTEFGSAIPWAGGLYYIAVKQRLTPTLVGAGHMSAITSRKINFRTTVPYSRDASTTTIDLSNDPAITDAPGAGGIYKETCYKPSADKPDALFEDPASHRRWFRAGEMEVNNVIDVGDSGIWIRLFGKKQAGGADDPADPYIRVDLDRNGVIDVGDRGYWIGTFNFMYLGGDPTIRDPGPHGYVPAIIP